MGNRKKISILFVGGWVIVALALGVCRGAISLSDTVFYGLYGLLNLGILVSWYGVNQRWYRNFVKQVAALDVILTREHDPDRYIAENEKLLAGKKSAQIKTMLWINLCRGYCAKGDYKKAQQKLELVQEKKIIGIQKFAYRADCAYVAFYLGENHKALSYMAKNKHGIDRFEKNKELGGLIAILHIFELLATDKPELAQALYTHSKDAWEDEQNKEDFRYLKALLWKDEVEQMPETRH